MIRKEKREDCQRFRDLEWNAAGKRGRINGTKSIGDWKVAELSPLFYFLPLIQRDNRQEKQKKTENKRETMAEIGIMPNVVR